MTLRRSMKILILAFATVAILGASACAAGIDSRTYRCGDLHSLIASRGFVFVSQPAFGDFVVASPYYCGGGEFLTSRVVPTLDRPECPVNYCESRWDSDR
jgi:hypothetical protein